MKRLNRTFVPSLAVLIIALGPLGACGDDDGTGPPPPPPTGSVEVTTATTGGSIDADGYLVAVAGGAAQAIGTDAVLAVDDVEVGATSVELTDVASNCTVGGENPRTVQVTDGGVAATVFVVTCEPIGSIEVTTSTTGGAIDDDGYSVSVVGGAEQPIGANATLTLDQIAAGTRSVVLTGVADNCTVAGDNPRELAVTADATVSTQFDVTCIAPIEGQIVFYTDRDGDVEVYVMDEDGSNPVNLTNSPDVEGTPTVSPDGLRIAFLTDRDGNAEIYAMNADGSDQVNLTTDSAFDQNPAWSPDGSQIAFASDRSGDSQIWLMDADGSNPTNLTNLPGSGNQYPTWSPDGSQIAFATGRDGDAEIYVMDADGSNPTNLTNHPAGEELEPAWSPDGTRIAFQTDRDGNFEIYVMNADGSGQTRLTNDPGFDQHPSWSPDGSQILFATDRNGDQEIFVMNADGSGQVPLSASPTTNELPGYPIAWR